MPSKKTGLFLLSFLIFLPVMVYALNRDQDMVPANGFFLRKGDAEAGRKAFKDLKCIACHWVANDAELSQGGPVAEKAGPLLGPKQAAYSRGWIANSIVSPSHTIAAGSNGQAEGSDLSRMGDFTETMTVRQLIDLVEFIKSPPEKPAKN